MLEKVYVVPYAILNQTLIVDLGPNVINYHCGYMCILVSHH